jgi:L-amino acid N-acyltransferase YncA
MLRHADPARDGAACAAIYRPFVEHAATSFEEAAPGAEAMAARIAAYAATHPWLVYELDGAVVGFAYAAQHRVRPAYRWAADVSIYVDPVAHRRGIGRELYGALFDLLRRQRLLIAISGITLPNHASVGLHESLGFVRVGIYRSIGFKDGAWRDVGWWQLQLSAAPAVPLEPLGPQILE